MQAGTKPPAPSHITLLPLLLILFSVCLLSTGSGRSVSGNASQLVPIGSSPTQDRKSGDEIWGIADRTTLAARVEPASPRAYQVVEFHEDALSRALANVPMEFTEAARSVQVVVSLPMPDGSFPRFRIEESPVMEPDLAAQFPEVKSYRGQGVDDPTATTRFDWSPNGFHAIVLSANGTVFIARYTADDERNYISFYKEDLQDGFQPPQCEVTEAMQESSELRRQFGAEGFAPNAFVGTSLRTYRLALATTVEYTNNTTYGGTKASTLTKLNTIVNLINAIYEREVSIRFQLVSGEMSIIFDAEPDGYTNSDVGTMLNENPTVLNATIGSAAYDIGHVFGLSSAGSSSGVAQLAVVCGASKGRGASVLGIALATGNFSIDSGLVAHEWGHQFSASHTFNSSVNFCGTAGQRNASTAFEPGSGSTLMAYPGICSPENLQQNSDSYFHGGSFDQIASYSAGSGNACAAATATGNNPPTVSAGLDFTIPMGTPFTLTATGSDPDGDLLTYSWEELDTGTASPPMTDDGTRPLFRSFPALTSPSRTFPKLSDILNNTSTIGETLPTTTRSMNFRVTARDNRATGGGVNSAAMILNVKSASGPFVVTQPNTAVTWMGGSSQTVTWSVANTSSLPVNCALVKISFSTDGGNSFPTVLAASTPNDGTETVVIPNISTTTARIKVEAVANVFFDISNTNFTVTQASGTIQATVQTNPTGRSFTVDGTTYTTSQTFSWASGTNHTIATSSPQSGGTGTQYVWSNWSDGGGISHTVAPTVNATYTPNFTTQYFLTVSAGAGGTVSPSSNWFNSGQSVPINATPNSGFGFSGWTGSGTGSFTGSTNPAAVTMNGPITESASFTNVTRTLTVSSSNPSSGVSITISPNDNNGQGSGATQFSRVYFNNAVATLTAPSTSAGNFFQKWQRDGVDVSTSLTTNVTMDANHTMTAVYLTPIVCTVTPINFGQSMNGALAASDCRSPVRGSTYYADRYSFNAPAGQRIAISLTSSAFDTYLYLIGPSGSVITEDDNGGGVSNSRIPSAAGLLSLTLGGTYTIEVTSLTPNNTGSYNLTLFGDDTDGDGIPDVVEFSEGTNPLVKDNDIFNNARLFVMQQFRDFLGREGDPGGINFWTNELNTGTATRAQVIDAFFNSPEFQGSVSPVTRLYFAYFLRIPDYGGLIFWVNQYRQGAALDSISQAFAASPEFQATYGSLNNTQFVILVYQNVLERVPDSGGLAFWVGQLNSGAMTRGQVMLGFSESPEYKQASFNKVYVTMIYVGMLRRSPDQGGFDFWVNQLNNGASGLNLIQGFLSAPEYHNRFLP